MTPSPTPTPTPAAVVARFSTQEKIRLLSGRDFWSTESGRGLASVTMADGPHGLRRQVATGDHLGLGESVPATCFPPAAGLGATWDVGLIREVGEAIGREAAAQDVGVVLGPGLNIKRHPGGGRNFEYFSEDPLLAGALGVAWVNGVQSTGVGTSLKHFAVNSQETERMAVSAELDERTLREIYLPAFEAVVKEAQPTTVMSSYNAINGVFSSENRQLLTGILREEWGFDGLVVSDWGAIKDRAEALNAGLDLEMPTTDGEGTQALVAAVQEGRIDRATVETSIERLRRLAERTATQPSEGFDVAAHHALAQRAAAESMVLLRNEGILPFRAGMRVAVIGEFAASPQFQGRGSSFVNPTRVDVPLDELRHALGEENVSFASGYGGGSDAERGELLADAVVAARNAEVAVVFVGLREADQSEGFDRADLLLPEDQVQVIMAVAEVAPVVVVLANGGVVTMEGWHDQTAAILETWAGGQGVGKAIADILTGTVSPSGRLSETIPLRLEDTPSFLTFPGENGVVRHGEGVFVGYRYYSTVDRPVRYPFGHGLGYTTFRQELDVEVAGPDAALASVTVTNVGDMEAAEVVQLYVAPVDPAVRRPRRELAAFAKVRLAPGESCVVELPLERRRFAHWDVGRHDWRVAPGAYSLELGRSAAEIIETREVELAGDVERPEPLTLDSTVKAWFAHPVVGPLLQEAMLADATPEQRAAAEANADMLRMVETMPMRQFARFPGVEISDDILTQLSAQSAAE